MLMNLLRITTLSCLVAAASPAADITVNDEAALRAALRQLRPGTTLKLAPGTYPGGHQVSGVKDLTIEALDPAHPPHFSGGGNAWQFSACDGLTLRHLKISGQTQNGLNLDDGGRLDQPAKGITLEHIHISDVGPKGNHDGIKCSGLVKATIRACTITGWGGQGIDFVGCHDSLVTGCTFQGKDGFTASAGVQMKGGSSKIVVEDCRFLDAGERPLNIGGSTGLPFFRPQEATAEAKDITVRRCTIQGSLCAAAFVGVDGAEFSNNQVQHPRKWLLRILQETQAPRFVPCRNVVVRENHFTFRRADVSVEVNIGSGTAPETFVFEKNTWLAEDAPERSKPRLPSIER